MFNVKNITKEVSSFDPLKNKLVVRVSLQEHLDDECIGKLDAKQLVATLSEKVGLENLHITPIQLDGFIPTKTQKKLKFLTQELLANTHHVHVYDLPKIFIVLDNQFAFTDDIYWYCNYINITLPRAEFKMDVSGYLKYPTATQKKLDHYVSTLSYVSMAQTHFVIPYFNLPITSGILEYLFATYPMESVELRIKKAEYEHYKESIHDLMFQYGFKLNVTNEVSTHIDLAP